MSDYLPEEMVVRIFEKLPTKSLIKFTCLSKRWKHIILSDPGFAKTHFQIASQNQTLTRRFLFTPKSDENPRLEFVDLEAAGGNSDSCCVGKKAHTPFINGSDYIIGGCSCNGIVCVLLECSISKQTRLCIWNPSTGCYKEFPGPNKAEAVSDWEYDNTFAGFISCFGIGYVSATDEYKVIVRIELEEFNIMSLRAADTADTADTWKQIEPPFRFIPSNGGSLVHEALHWMKDFKEIIGFDLYKEEFRKVPLPPSFNTSFLLTTVGVSVGGCLCLMNSNPDCSTEFWVMTEYGVVDSWTRQFTLSNLVPVCRLVLATETTVFVHMEREGERCDRKLIRISGNDENKVQICMDTSEIVFRNAMGYQETLLWLP